MEFKIVPTETVLQCRPDEAVEIKSVATKTEYDRYLELKDDFCSGSDVEKRFIRKREPSFRNTCLD